MTENVVFSLLVNIEPVVTIWIIFWHFGTLSDNLKSTPENDSVFSENDIFSSLVNF